MVNQVYRYMQQFHMIEKGDIVVAGVSGGADSVCLFLLLEEFRHTIPFTLAVVHVHHGMRKEADAEGAYVEKLCKEREVPFFLVNEDVGAVAKKLHMSVEEAGRKVRYEAFERVLLQMGEGKSGGQKIAVAHHKNDCAETVLFHLFRGSSIKGLCGIVPVRGHVIRPLLCVERTQIEHFLEEKRVPYCIDKTNEEDTYTRNKIRHHILSFAEEEISAGAVAHIADTAQFLADTDTLLQRLTAQAYQACVREEKEEGKVFLLSEKVLQLESVLQKYLIMECLFRLSGSRKDITASHVEDVRLLFAKQVGKLVALPYRLTAQKEYTEVCIFSEEKKLQERSEKNNNKGEYRIEVGTKIAVEGLGFVQTRVFEAKISQVIPEKTYTKWFDYDKIGESLVLRTRKPGDFLTIQEGNHKKALKEYMINEKIPRTDRESLFVIAERNHILWLIGYRISQYYKVSQDTKRILEVRITEGEKDGGACGSHVNRSTSRCKDSGNR